MALMDRVSKTASEAGQKTRDLANIAGLNGRNADNNRKIKRLYEEIGEAYCTAHTTDAEAALAEQVKSVRELKRQNEEWDNQIHTLRKLVKCPNCGQYVAKKAPFCTFCGQRLLAEGAVICPVCGAVTEQEDVKFCQQCGNPLPDRGTQAQPEPEATANAEPEGPRCTNCGAPLAPGTLFCTECGTPVEKTQPEPEAQPQEPQEEATTAKRFCTNCGAEQAADAMFCTECGARLS